MDETLVLARALATASGRRLSAERLAKHLRAEALTILVRDHELDILVTAPGFARTVPGGPSWDAFFARAHDLGIHAGAVAYPDISTLVPFKAVVRHDGAFVLLGGSPVVDEAVELAASFLVPLLCAEQIAIASAGRVAAAQEAARHASGLAAALDVARAEVERALRAKQESLAELQASNEEHDRLLGIVGHDLRNPLAAITTSAALIARRGGLAPEQGEAIRRIQRTSERMAQMIHGLLDRERIRSAGGIAIEPRATSVSDLIRQVVEEAELAHPRATFDLKSDVAGMTAMWDPVRVAQLLSNLLANAVEHGRRGGTIAVTAVGRDDSVTIDVSNALDAEITKEQLGRVFDPFHRGQASRGLGLGLHVVRAIATAHGGSATVSSERDTIRFSVKLPRATRSSGRSSCSS